MLIEAVVKGGEKMDVFIVTGSTSGIGQELVKQLIDKNKRVFGIARGESKLEHPNYHHVLFDLATTEKVAETLEELLNNVIEEATSLTLINNAGTIEPIGTAGEIDSNLVAKSIAVNLTAPMILTGTFIRMTEQKEVPKKIMQISSGAGRNGYEGWSSYCAGKAGLDRFTEAVQLEESRKTNGVKLVSIAPGIIDTNMQGKIRDAKESEFALVNKFREYKVTGQLSSAEEVASKLIGFLVSDQYYTSEVVTDLRQL
ncbi:SDR family NAD(P)-dependent oxidoreductase [uncultured Psychrobacillus sp.]|uniref:SDR family NAD(P)-dependent oxidoreductase n=1 Tax=uncultured Psychrobacillus sp. TaxID=1551585 RepID=UPI00260ED388|nr:SDR family NAD(P)-dependent oxidoreductase [uncultured Psychrobacillus sp.]